MNSNKSVASCIYLVVFRSVFKFSIHELDGKGLYNFEDIKVETFHGSKYLFPIGMYLEISYVLGQVSISVSYAWKLYCK